jgi:hypothetical protein
LFTGIRLSTGSPVSAKASLAGYGQACPVLASH